MSQPLVSIVCEVYNHEPYLRQCLDGFVMQKTSFPYEILIHDDASTDGSANIIREYEAKYPELFKPIYQTENQYSKGVQMWASIQFPRAKGKYIAICEGDDYWTDPMKLQRQVDFLEANNEYSMCFHSARVLFEGNPCPRLNDFFTVLEERDYSSTEVFEKWIVPTASIVFRKDQVLQYTVKHPEWLTRGDIGLVLRCTHTGKVWGMIPQMSVYRIQPESVSHNQKYRGKEVYLLPKHFRCILQNFPKVSLESVKWSISHAYYSRMKCQRTIWRKMDDFVLCLYWHPRFATHKLVSNFKRLWKNY